MCKTNDFTLIYVDVCAQITCVFARIFEPFRKIHYSSRSFVCVDQIIRFFLSHIVLLLKFYKDSDYYHIVVVRHTCIALFQSAFTIVICQSEVNMKFLQAASLNFIHWQTIIKTKDFFSSSTTFSAKCLKFPKT